MRKDQLVELALELRRQIAGGAPEADLLLYLGHDLRHVGLRVRGCQRGLLRRVCHVGHACASRWASSSGAISAIDSRSGGASTARTGRVMNPVALPGLITSK